MLNTLGTALYRAGRFQEAIERLHAGITAHGHGCMPHDWLVLAIAHHQFGHTEEAQRWLQKANDWIEQSKKPTEHPAGGGSSSSDSWRDRLELRLLHREAAEVLGK